MITEQKHLLRSLRRSHTSSSTTATTTPSSASSSTSSSPSSSSWIHLRSVLFVVTNSSSSSSPVSTDRITLKSPWSRRRRKRALLPKQWKRLFGPDGKLSNGGVKFLKKVRSGGVDPSIRVEVWPFLLGVYDLNSTKEERDTVRSQKRKEYKNLRRRCRRRLKRSALSFKGNDIAENGNGGSGGFFIQVPDTPDSDDMSSPRTSNDGDNPSDSDGPIWDPEILPSATSIEEEEKIELTCEDGFGASSDSSDSESSEEGGNVPFVSTEEFEENELDENAISSPSKAERGTNLCSSEDFATWQRIIRVDAVRANPEWIVYSPSQAAVSEAKAKQQAEKVGLKEYDHLEPCMIYHATRLVSILEAYALYDPETGYCQGMSDLLSPIISVIEDDHEAFWCFVGFMRKARHNFRLDEVGIRRQLGLISKIIKCKDSHLYRHLEKLQAEDCFFVYRMVVVLFRRELTFEQTLCLWEVMWADQTAIRAGISKSEWGKMRLRAPPTEDLLLYAIAACVLQRRRLILEKYNSMDEIIRECNNMAGNLDVWKLLDDAHDLVVTLHDKI